MFVAFDDPEEEFAFLLDLVEGCGDLCFQMPEVFFHAAETSSAPGCEERKPVEFDGFNSYDIPVNHNHKTRRIRRV